MASRPPHLASANGILGFLPEFVKLSQNRFRAQIRLLGLAALVGIVAGLGAIAFYIATRVAEHYALGMIAGYSPEPRPGGEAAMPWLPVPAHPLVPWLLLLIPTIGGLISGVIVFTFAPEAEGHGTDAVIAAYHHHQGQIRPRVPLVKIIASSITLGTGGSGGREGPIAQIGAGFGSLLGNLLHLRPAERRVLMAAGMGAGIGAIFRAPLAGTIFAAEVLYGSTEFEPEVIIPAGIATVISYSIYGMYSGWQPLFTMPPDLAFSNPLRLGPYLLLAVFMALLAAFYTRTFYGCKDWFDRMPVPQAFSTGDRCLPDRADRVRPVLPLWQEPTGAGRARFRLFVDPKRHDAGRRRHRWNPAGHCVGQDSHDQLDDRQRGIGRSIWAFDGHRRMRRRGVGGCASPFVAVAGASPGELRHRGNGRFLRRRSQDAVFYLDYRQ